MALIGRPCSVCGARTDGSGRCDRHREGGALPRPCLSCGTSTVGDLCRDCLAEESRLRERGRLAKEPYRVGYSDPAYWHARRVVIRRAAGRCEECGEPFTRDDPLETHHVVELSEGGRNTPDNLVAIHRSENQAHRRARARQRRKAR